MTDFDKKYILKCLKSMGEILANPVTLQAAVTDFTQGKAKERFSKNDLVGWEPQEKLHLNAAFFEATARTHNELLTQPELAQQVALANELFAIEYLPELTKDANTSNRLGSVRTNIKNKILEIKGEPLCERITHYAQESPFTFYGAVSLTVAGAALGFVAGIKLSQ